MRGRSRYPKYIQNLVEVINNYNGVQPFNCMVEISGPYYKLQINNDRYIKIRGSLDRKYNVYDVLGYKMVDDGLTVGELEDFIHQELDLLNNYYMQGNDLEAYINDELTARGFKYIRLKGIYQDKLRYRIFVVVDVVHNVYKVLDDVNTYYSSDVLNPKELLGAVDKIIRFNEYYNELKDMHRTIEKKVWDDFKDSMGVVN